MRERPGGRRGEKEGSRRKGSGTGGEREESEGVLRGGVRGGRE